MANEMRPVPPGEILNEEFLKPLGLTANALAKAIGVPPNRITAILKNERGITGGHGDPAGNVFQQERAGVICKTDGKSLIVPIASGEILASEMRKVN